MANADLHEKGH